MPLILQRGIGQSIIIDDKIKITLKKISSMNKISLSFESLDGVKYPIIREEIAKKKDDKNEK